MIDAKGNAKKKGYDLTMEVLCSLSRVPTPVAELAEDLQCRPDHVEAAIRGLRSRFGPTLRVIVQDRMADGKRSARLVGSAALPLQMAEEYWDRQYGAGT